jgi:chorismate-pyruvate lyase
MTDRSMNTSVRKITPDVVTLFSQFPPALDIPRFEHVAADAVPEPYHTLLVHEHHMTVTVEKHHGDLVDVCILARRHNGSSYARKIVLALQKTGKLVQFGIVRINLDYCSPEVRDKIIAGNTPLGRILIEHNVLRRIELTAFLRIDAGPQQMAWFGQTGRATLYGRLGYIHCDEQPAVELLEILAPE